MSSTSISSAMPLTCSLKNAGFPRRFQISGGCFVSVSGHEFLSRQLSEWLYPRSIGQAESIGEETNRKMFRNTAKNNGAED